MKTKELTLVLSLALVIATGASVAEERAMPDVASMSTEEVVALRKAIMKEDGRLLRDASKLSGEEAVLAAKELSRNVVILQALFPEGSASSESSALDVVWSDWEGFNHLFKEISLQAEAMAGAATVGDAPAYTSALKAAATICGDCHTGYRAP